MRRWSWSAALVLLTLTGWRLLGPSPAPAAPPAQTDRCAPRPPVGVAVVSAGANRVQVSLTAGTSAALPDNRLQTLRFGAATNALVDLPGGPTGASGALTVTLAPGTQQTQFFIRQSAPGGYTTVPLTVVDACGDWTTFVGGGPGAFLTATPTLSPTATATVPRSPTLTRTPTAIFTRTPTATATAVPNFGLRLDPVVTGLASPLHVTHAGDGSADLYVVEKRGVIRRLSGGTLTVFLDVASLVGSGGSEQGLLGLAFHPRYTTNRYLDVNYTDLNGNTVIARYTASTDRTRAEPATASPVLQIAQPAPNHNGGLLLFGPDGYLYIGTGDGGGGGDPFRNGQNPQTLLGKMLRIDVTSAQPYAIPTTNPYVGVAGTRGEIWAIGLRNPWRYSFDRGTGDLYVADVGQAQYEEINRQPASSPGGENYGWPIMEGFHCYPETASCNQTGLQRPIAEYPHSLGCSVTGGYVYRGAAYPVMRGLYLFADYCSGRFWTLQPQAAAPWPRTERLDSTVNVSSFGEDYFGELYVTGLGDGTLYRVAAVLR